MPTTDTILALDLGKYKSVAGVYRTADDVRFTTTRAEAFPRARAVATAVR
jgi:hypothetical protein